MQETSLTSEHGIRYKCQKTDHELKIKHNGAERLSLKLHDFMKSHRAKQTGRRQNACSAFVNSLAKKKPQ